MATEGQTFDQWLKDAKVPRHALSPQQLAVLQAAFGFLRRCGCDYYSLRMLSHFLLNCDPGLKVAQVARLVKASRQTASRQQKLFSKEVVQSAHKRMAGRAGFSAQAVIGPTFTSGPAGHDPRRPPPPHHLKRDPWRKEALRRSPEMSRCPLHL